MATQSQDTYNLVDDRNTNTVAFSHGGNRWITRYSWVARLYSHIARIFVSNPDGAGGTDFVWKHDNGPNNTFFGIPGYSAIAVSFNQNPSQNKIYKSYSIEGTNNLISGASAIFANPSPDPDQLREAVFGPIKPRGGINYGHIRGNTAGKEQGNSIKLLGRIVRGVDIVDDGNTGYPFGFGYTILELDHVNGMLNPTADNSKLILGFTQPNGDIIMYSPQAFGGLDPIEPPYFDFPGSQEVTQETPYDDINEVISVGNQAFQYYSSQLGIKGVIVQIENFLDGADGVQDSAFYLRLNAYMEDNPSLPVFLFQVTEGDLNGSSLKGQYADAYMVLGSEEFEVFAINANYSPYNLDHNK